MNLRKIARGKDCQIRLPNICNHDPQTTVGAHFRLSGLSGMGTKPDDIFIAWACSACHAWVDGHKSNEVQIAFAHGVFRTQAALLKMGAIKT
jgi:hypothetical protein